jgi:hypothetical protein
MNYLLIMSLTILYIILYTQYIYIQYNIQYNIYNIILIKLINNLCLRKY